MLIEELKYIRHAPADDASMIHSGQLLVFMRDIQALELCIKITNTVDHRVALSNNNIERDFLEPRIRRPLNAESARG